MELKIELCPPEGIEVNDETLETLLQQILPTYSSEFSSGADVRAINIKRLFNRINEERPISFLKKSTDKGYLIIRPGERMLIGVGFKVELPPTHEIQIRPKSGLGLKKGLSVAWGTIDSDYRGEIGVVVRNKSDIDVRINLGEEIAQMVLVKKSEKITGWSIVTSVLPTERGEKGFGEQTEVAKNKEKSKKSLNIKKK